MEPINLENETQPKQSAAENEQTAAAESELAEPIRAKAVLDGKMQSRIGRENRNAGILFAVLGAVAVAFGAVLCALPLFGGGRMIFGILLIVLGALLFLCGVVLLALQLRSVAQADKLHMVNEYAFFEDTFTVHTLRGEEDLGTGSYAYSDLFKVKEKHGIIQLFPSSNVVFPVDEAAFSPEELASLRRTLGLGQK